MSNGLGLFGWIREGVKQSVLMGVSDAIDTIGAPEEKRELNPALLAFARQDTAAIASAHTASEPPKRLGGTLGSTGRKRLGRSLRDNIDPSKPTT